ncbi:MAG: hypothetical protein KM310_00660 [Clostridiales bacterium]|nr:hypothetical protein [Clostridiales bacterium]
MERLERPWVSLGKIATAKSLMELYLWPTPSGPKLVLEGVQYEPRLTLRHYLDLGWFLTLVEEVVSERFKTRGKIESYKGSQGRSRVLEVRYLADRNYPYQVVLHEGPGETVGKGIVKPIRLDQKILLAADEWGIKSWLLEARQLLQLELQRTHKEGGRSSYAVPL